MSLLLTVPYLLVSATYQHNIWELEENIMPVQTGIANKFMYKGAAASAISRRE